MNLNLRFCNFILIFIFLFSMPAWAGPLENEESLEETPRHLDFVRRDAVLSRFEITPYGGDYIGDTLQHSFMVGSQFDFRITPMWSVGLDFGWTPISVDPTSNFGSTVTNKNMYLIDAKVDINLPGAYVSRNKVVEVDFFTNLGPAIILVNNSTRMAGFIGGGMKIYSKKTWIGFRVDVRNYFLTLPTPNGDDFTFDLTIMVGPTFQLPPYF